MRRLCKTLMEIVLLDRELAALLSHGILTTASINMEDFYNIIKEVVIVNTLFQNPRHNRFFFQIYTYFEIS